MPVFAGPLFVRAASKPKRVQSPPARASRRDFAIAAPPTNRIRSAKAAARKRLIRKEVDRALERDEVELPARVLAEGRETLHGERLPANVGRLSVHDLQAPDLAAAVVAEE